MRNAQRGPPRPPSSAAQRVNECRIWAGICIFDGSRVEPQKDRGILAIERPTPSALQVQWWKEDEWTGSGQAEVFKVKPGENPKLERIKECTTGHVYVLRGYVTASGSVPILWLQDPEESNHENTIEKANLLLSPPAPAASHGGGRDSQAFAKTLPRDQVNPVEPASIRSILTTDALKRLASDPKFVKELERHAPPEVKGQEAIQRAVLGPHFRNACESLTGAVNSQRYKSGVYNAVGFNNEHFASLYNGGGSHMSHFIRAYLVKYPKAAGYGVDLASGTVRPSSEVRNSEDEPPAKVSKTSDRKDDAE